jgi:hypothetical protein
MMSGMDLPSRAIREQIASAVNVIVQQSRLSDGSRKVVSASEVLGIQGDHVEMREIFTFVQTGYDSIGKVLGYFKATGTIPVFVEDMLARGIKIDMTMFREGTETAH